MSKQNHLIRECAMSYCNPRRKYPILDEHLTLKWTLCEENSSILKLPWSNSWSWPHKLQPSRCRWEYWTAIHGRDVRNVINDCFYYYSKKKVYHATFSQERECVKSLYNIVSHLSHTSISLSIWFLTIQMPHCLVSAYRILMSVHTLY